MLSEQFQNYIRNVPDNARGIVQWVSCSCIIGLADCYHYNTITIIVQWGFHNLNKMEEVKFTRNIDAFVSE